MNIKLQSVFRAPLECTTPRAYARSRVAYYVELARKSGALFDSDGTPLWSPEPEPQDESDFFRAFENAHDRAPSEDEMMAMWDAWLEAAFEAAEREAS